MTQYSQFALQDRTLAKTWAIKAANGEIYLEETNAPGQIEPIVEDAITPGTYWKFFVDNGEMRIESTMTAQNSVIDIIDSVLSNTMLRLGASNWEWFYTQMDIPDPAETAWIPVTSEDGSWTPVL